MFCPKCGTKLPDDVIFCIHCGNRIGGKVTPPEVQQPAPAPAAPVAAAVEAIPQAPASDFVAAVQPEFPPVPEVPEAPVLAPVMEKAPAFEPEQPPAAVPPAPPAPPVPPQNPVPNYSQYPVYGAQQPKPQPEPPVQPAPPQPKPKKAVAKKRLSAGSKVLAILAALLMIGSAVVFFLMKTIHMDFEVIINNGKLVPWNEFKLTELGNDTLMKILSYAIPGCLALGGILLLLSGFGVPSKLPCVLGFLFGLLGVGGFVAFWILLFKATEGTGWSQFLPALEDPNWPGGWLECFRAYNTAPTTTTMPAMPFGWIALGCGGLGTLFALVAAFIPKKTGKAQ